MKRFFTTLKAQIRKLFRWLYQKVFGRNLDNDFATLDHIDELKDLSVKLTISDQKLRCAIAQLQPSRKMVSPDKASVDSNSWCYDELFVLGSGASLLRLSEAEKDILRGRPTLAMNKYILYWDLIGIWPTYSFLADAHYPSTEVFTRSIETIMKNRSLGTPTLLLSEVYRAWPLQSLKSIFFKRKTENQEEFYWANSLEEEMYFHRGSLTCLLNLVTVLRLAPRVTLLGVDLGNGEAFYQKQYNSELALHDTWEAIRSPGRPHPTAVEISNIAPIQKRLPEVFQMMKQKGIDVSCYSSESLLVQQRMLLAREKLVSDE